MDIGSVIKITSTVISVAKPILENIAPKLQESMKDFSERLLVLADKYPSLEEYAHMIDKAAEIMGDVLYVLGISADPADELGVKAAQAEKTAAEFDSIEEYIAYLKNDIELDKERMANMSEEERIAYTITGMAIEAGAIGEKLGVEIPAEAVTLVASIAELGKYVIDGAKIVSVMTGLRDDGITNMKDICELIEGNGTSDRMKTGDVLVNVLDKLSPGKGEDTLIDIENEMRK